MRHAQPATMSRYRGMSWAPVLFLLAFLVATAVLAFFFLEPALRIANEGTPEARRRITAYGALALCILILILLAGLLMTMRMGRSVALLATPKRNKPTVYPDAWAESAKRIEVPAPEDMESPDESDDRDHEKPKD